jgi:putative membrane protein
MKILFNWIIMAIAIIITAYILPGVTVSGFIPAFFVAVVLSLVNVSIKPLLLILTLPINILTLGLFTFAINAFLIMLVSYIVPGFKVDGFWWAMLFSIVLAVILFLINRIKKDEDKKI